MDRNLHRQHNPQITVKECWHRRNCFLVDVRSPQEFLDGCLPDAVNLPLLDDTERKTVGILYKRYGQRRAVERGYRILEPKLDALRKRFQRFPKSKTAVVYCSRGGMRSQVITALMRSFGYRARQLAGGYKGFRTWNIKQLEQFEYGEIIVLHGQTGVGKTAILNRLQNAVDLEGIAGHRGSMFGGIGKIPATQKRFDANLLRALEAIDTAMPLFVEGESRKIGAVTIPRNLYDRMQRARNLLLKAPLHIRVERTVEEYITRQPDAIPEIRSTIGYLKRDLGKAEVTRLRRLLDEKEYRECFRGILESYYDKKYSHGINRLSYEREIDTEIISAAVSRIMQTARSLRS